MNAPRRTIVLFSNDPRASQPSMERKVRNEVTLARRQPREADTCHADEARFLRKDLDVAERAQDLDESSGESENRWIGAGEKRLEREVSARMPEVLRDEARAAPRARPHWTVRAWHGRSLLVSGCDPARRTITPPAARATPARPRDSRRSPTASPMLPATAPPTPSRRAAARRRRRGTRTPGVAVRDHRFRRHP